MHFLVDEAEARAALAALIEERREDYAGLSRLIGRNPAYIQQYLKRGTPRRLAEADRRRLAAYFEIDEARLGGPPAPPAARGQLVAVRRLDVGAAAGAGAFTGDEAKGRAGIAFDRRFLREIAHGAPDRLSLIRVQGDSMEPALSDGDDIMVDQSDAGERLRDGVYVIRIDSALAVKRLARRPGGKLAVRSDNPAWPEWECAPGEVAIVGRVVWAGRRLR